MANIDAKFLHWLTGGRHSRDPLPHRSENLQMLLSLEENKNEPLLEGQDIGKGIKIEALKAIGGFAFTYLASKREGPECVPVAVKVFKGGAVDYKSINAERQFLKELKHLNVPRFVDFGEITTRSLNKRFWIAMEWIEGKTLWDYAAATAGKLRPKDWFKLLKPIFEALEKAHSGETGIRFAHCDISPRNILIEEKKEHPKAWLVDFGVAKRLESEKAKGQTSNASALWASPDFMFPECYSKKQRSAATDVHSLALILSWLLTGNLPYLAKGGDPLKAEVLSESRPTPSKKGFDVGCWEAVITQALALDPGDRFETAGQFLKALESAIPNEIKRLADQDAVTDEEMPNTLSDTVPDGSSTSVVSNLAPDELKPRELQNNDSVPISSRERSQQQTDQSEKVFRAFRVSSLPIGILSVSLLVWTQFSPSAKHSYWNKHSNSGLTSQQGARTDTSPPSVEQATTSNTLRTPPPVAPNPPLPTPKLAPEADFTQAPNPETVKGRDIGVVEAASTQSDSISPDPAVRHAEPVPGPSLFPSGIPGLVDSKAPSSVGRATTSSSTSTSLSVGSKFGTSDAPKKSASDYHAPLVSNASSPRPTSTQKQVISRGILAKQEQAQQEDKGKAASKGATGKVSVSVTPPSSESIKDNASLFYEADEACSSSKDNEKAQEKATSVYNQITDPTTKILLQKNCKRNGITFDK